VDKDEALKLLRGGEEGIREWNARRENGESVPGLDGVLLDNAHLRGADLSQLRLLDAHLSGVNLSRANLKNAVLFAAHLNDADLHNAHLGIATLRQADLSGACLQKGSLEYANLTLANLLNANLRWAGLMNAVIHNADLHGADFHGAAFLDTVVASDFSGAKGLRAVRHYGPSAVSTEALHMAKGQLPDVFLRGCGLQPWEVLAAKLYDPALTPGQVTDIQYKIFDARTRGPLALGGVFISYAHEDNGLANKLHDKLEDAGANAWLDHHDMLAGPLQKQVDRAIRLNDIVLLILSEASIASDWVEHELKMARKKEKEVGHSVLCPIALDDAWKDKMDDLLWEQALKNNVLDFSGWKTHAFDPVFKKLVKGLKIWYRPPTDAALSEQAAT
jgi:uncharacterized protein YjbI with pentapeptide repeats